MEILREISRGAEAILYKTRFLNIDSVIKYREPKKYMDPRLDKIIRERRTATEAKIMIELRERGVEVPSILYVEPEEGIIVMEFIEGVSLRDYLLLEKRDPTILLKAGEILGRIHSHNIFHGDPTITNYIVDRYNNLWIIDFGLSGYSDELEEKAVDLHLTYRSLETLPLPNADLLKQIFFEGYKRVYPDADKILRRVIEIRRMGRYVAERKIRGVYRF
ncbi:MAG: Kae1-associated kinase Bud32 [Sulfolobales archaeon]